MFRRRHLQTRWPPRTRRRELAWCAHLSHPPTTSLTFKSGLVILPSFLSHQHQRQLVRWALDHAKHPNDTNLDIHYLVPPEGIWNAHLRSGTQLIAPKYPGAAPHFQQSGPRQLINNTPASTETISLINSTPKPPPPPSATARPISPFALLYKLRWANIGWFYHWGVKQYDFTKGKGHIDSILRDLCQSAVAAVDWDALYTGSEAQWPQKRPEWRFWRETYGESHVRVLTKWARSDAFQNQTQGSSTFIKKRIPLWLMSIDQRCAPLLPSFLYRTPDIKESQVYLYLPRP